MTQPADSRNRDAAVPQRSGRRFLWWLVVLVLWGVCAAWYLRPPSPETVERLYSRGLYRRIVGALTPITERVPGSVAVALIAGLAAGFLLLWIANWVYLRRVRHASHGRGFFWGIKWALALAPLFVIWFLVFWGAGYQRQSIESRLSLDTAIVTAEEAAELRRLTLAVIKNDAPSPGARNVARAWAAISEAMAEIIESWDGTPVRLPHGVKATPKGLLLVTGPSGMCMPLTLEPNVDGALPDTAFVWTGAHELGHIAGLCGEAEATLIGYAAGLRAKDPYARYAVALNLYTDLCDQLAPDARKAALDLLPEVARDDLRAAREAYDRYRIDWFRRISWRLYNTYLQSQGIEEGVKDYSRGVALFTFAWRKGLIEFPKEVLCPPPVPPKSRPALPPTYMPGERVA